MSANVETMAYAGETPWHGLGNRVNKDASPREMLIASGLNWTVDKYPIYTAVPVKTRSKNKNITGSILETEVLEIPNRKALVRSTDKAILSIISDDWEPVQNYEAFKFFVDFVSKGKMEMHTAGSLNDGKNVWVLAKVKDGFTILGKDRVESYLLFSLPHEYGKSITVQFTPIRVVCWNTLSLSLRMNTETMVRLNHRKKFDAEAVKKMLGIAHYKLDRYKNMAEFLSSKQFNEETLTEFFNTVFPRAGGDDEDEDGEVKLSRPARVALSVLESQPGAEFGKGSWWQAFNAVSYSTDHLLGHTPETRLQSIWYGQNKDRKLTALETAVKMAEAA